MNQTGHDQSHSLLTPGRNCWRVETADRFAVLMENAAYFDALRSALGKARRSIVILGWQFDPRTRLYPDGRDESDEPDEVGHMLLRLVRRRRILLQRRGRQMIGGRGLLGPSSNQRAEGIADSGSDGGRGILLQPQC